ncbi:hypothetical protein Tco_0270981 [Tanacetum coccineum]
MDDPNITMEEYIRLEEEKARRHGRTFNLQTDTFGKVKNYEDEDDCFIDFETEFPTIVFDNTALPSEPMVCPPNENKVYFRISLDESVDEDYMVIFDENSFSYKIILVNDLKTDSGNDNDNMPLLPNPTIDYLDDLDFFKKFENEFPTIVYNDAQKSKSDYLTKPILNLKHIDEFNLNDEKSLSEYDKENSSEGNETTPGANGLSKTNMAPLLVADQRHPWLRYQVKGYTKGIVSRFGSEVEDGVYLRGASGVRGIKRRMTWRQFILAFRLHTEQEMAGQGLVPTKMRLIGPAPSYVLIQDPVMGLCHKMIAYSISGRGQTSEKVTGVDLFYLRSMDRGTTNDPHLLAHCLFRHAEGRTSRARLSGGHFIRHLAMHFGLVAQGPERQQAAADGAHEADEAGSVAEEGAQEIPAPAQEPPPPPPAP